MKFYELQNAYWQIHGCLWRIRWDGLQRGTELLQVIEDTFIILAVMASLMLYIFVKTQQLYTLKMDILFINYTSAFKKNLHDFFFISFRSFITLKYEILITYTSKNRKNNICKWPLFLLNRCYTLPYLLQIFKTFHVLKVPLYPSPSIPLSQILLLSGSMWFSLHLAFHKHTCYIKSELLVVSFCGKRH